MPNQSQSGTYNSNWTFSQPHAPLPPPPSNTTSSRHDTLRPPISAGSISSSSSSNRHLTNHSHHHYPTADHDPSLLYAHQNYSTTPSTTPSNTHSSTNSTASSSDNSARSMSFLKNNHHTNTPQQGVVGNSRHNKQSSLGNNDSNSAGSGISSHRSNLNSIGHSSSNSSNISRELPSVQQTVSSIPSMLLLQQQQQQQQQLIQQQQQQQLLLQHLGDGSFENDLHLQQQLQHHGGDNVIMQEWLHKRSSSLQLVWKRRWCVLREDRLYFYRSNTDTKPIGMLHLSEYSILAAGPDISRKSKLAFRLSSPEPIPHQHQHHVFFTESAQSLHNWLHSLQLHINHATTVWSSKAVSLTAAGLGLPQAGAAGGGLSRRIDEGGIVPGQSIIDKVLDRLHMDESSTGGAAPDSTSTATGEQPRQPHIPPNFPQSHEDNNDTWSSTSSMPNTSASTSANLDYIFGLNQQNQAAKSSMDSTRDRSDHPHLQSSPIVGVNHQPTNPTPLSYATSSTGYAGSTFTDQSSISSEVNRFSMQSVDYQGRSSLHQPRPSPGAGNGFTVGSASPRMHPIRSSVHSGLSVENGSGSPATSAAGSPFASPTLSSQHPSLLSSGGNHNGHSHTGSASPRTFYRVLDNASPSKRAESIASSTSISTIASSGDVSTINDLNSENGLSSTATDSGLPSKPKSAGATILGLVTGGGKHKKDKKDGSSAGSNHSGSGSGSGSSGLKLFGSGVCHYSGCTQIAKTCTFHNKKFRPESPSAIASRKAKEEKKAAKEATKEEKRTGKSSLWSSSSDKSGSQGNISEISSPIMMKADGSLLSSYNGSIAAGRGLSSRSMVSLPRDAEFGIDPSMVPLPPSNLRSLASSPTRRRSPSVSVLEDSLGGNQQQEHSRPAEISTASSRGFPMRPQTPLSAAPSQPLPPPPPPPRAPSSASNHRPGSSTKETFSLSRKMGLQMGSEFGAVDKNALTGTALDGNYFVANHHRTMQKLQLTRKPQSQQQQFIDQQQQFHQQQQQQQYQQQQSELFKGVGVSRHIVAPDELAMAIEMEAEEIRRCQAQVQGVQKSRPTSMVKGGGAYHSMPIQLHLATVSESNVLSDGVDEHESELPTAQDSKGSPLQDGGKIISSQEQLAYAPLELPSMVVESDRSPISGFTAGISPLSPNPSSQLPPASLGITASDLISASGGGSSAKSSSHGSPRSNSLSAGSGVSSPGFMSSGPLAPLSSSSLYTRQITGSPGSGSKHPMSPMNASFIEEDQSEFPVRSLPPPKRHGNDQGLLFKGPVGDSNGTYRDGLPRRSSAAAAVTLSPTESSSASPLSSDQQGGAASSAPGTSLRPAYMTRRQSSSPVLIRVSDQGGQNISPLLTGGATRTFTGDAPSREVFRRPSELTTPTSSTGTGSSSSFVTSKYTGQDAMSMSPSQDGASISSLPSPTMARGRVFRTASSPLASVTPADGCTPSASPTLESVPRMRGDISLGSAHTASTQASASPSAAPKPYRFPVVASDDVPSVVVNRPHSHSASSSPLVQEPTKRVLHNASSFQFPAPSYKGNATETGASSRPLSSCSSTSSYSSAENLGAQEEDEAHHASMEEGYRNRQQQYQQQYQQQHLQRRGSNGLYHDGAHSPNGGMSPSLHAAALGLYPGLRKLSLFTAAVGDHPPPPLLSGRKGSAGSNASTRDYHHGVTSPTLSVMEDEDEVTTEDEGLDLHNDEDWAGNMKSMRRGYQDPAIVVVTATSEDTISGTPVSVVVDPGAIDGLSAPPSMPLPLTPPPLIPQPQPPRPTSSGMKELPVIPGSYYFPSPLSAPLPLTPPVSGGIPEVPAGVVAGDKNPLALAVATAGAGAPPVIPPRSPHRSAPGSPTTLRSMRSYQNLMPPPSGA